MLLFESLLSYFYLNYFHHCLFPCNIMSYILISNFKFNTMSAGKSKLMNVSLAMIRTLVTSLTPSTLEIWCFAMKGFGIEISLEILKHVYRDGGISLCKVLETVLPESLHVSSLNLLLGDRKSYVLLNKSTLTCVSDYLMWIPSVTSYYIKLEHIRICFVMVPYLPVILNQT